MYIKGKYWENYIGDSDDSLTLVEYLAGKGKEEITAGEIFSDFGADKLNGDFRSPETALTYTNEDGWVKSTRLCPYLSALTESEGDAFTAEILNRAKSAYRPTESGKVLLRFKRLFFTASLD